MTRLSALLLCVACLNACGGARESLARPSGFDAHAATPATFGRFDVSPSGGDEVDFAHCLTGSHDAGCFTSALSRIHPSATGPGAPTGLAAFVSGSTVTLYWTAPADAVIAYVLEAGSAPGSSNLASLSTGSTATSFIATGVTAGAYYVRIRALSPSSEAGSASNEIIVTVAGATPCSAPGAPSGLTLTSNSGGTVGLAWAPATGSPISYAIEAGSGPGLSNIANNDLGHTLSLSANGVSPGTYYVRVRARNGCGIGETPSNELIVTVAPVCLVPSAPLNLTANTSSTGVTLTWGAPVGFQLPTSYVVEIGSSSGSSNVTSTTVGGATFTTTLSAGTYYARVKASDACGTGVASAEISFTVTPAPTPTPTPCTYSLNPVSQSVAATATSGLTTTLTTICSWSAASDASWLTITAGASGTSSGTITYSAAANTATVARTGHITVSGTGGTAQLTVTQDAATATPTPCIYSMNPTSQAVAATATSGLTTTVTAGCSWSAASDVSWLTITTGSSGTASATITYSATANTGVARTGHITVTGTGGTTVLTVTQAAVACTYSLSPASQTVAATATSGLTTTLTTTCSWSTASDASWLTITAGASGTTSGTITYSAAANSATVARTGRITVSGTGGTAQLTVSQEAAVVTPPTPRTSFGAGRWLVGTEIVAGRYYSVPVSGCYWERLSGLGGTFNEILANDFVGYAAGQIIVDILSTDRAFSTDADCRTWFNTPRSGLQSGIAPGTWLVGSQVSPGTYSVAARSGCYWERLRHFTGNFDGIIDNEFVSAANTQRVTIASSDVGFHADDECGTWTRVADLTADGVAPAPRTGDRRVNRQLNRAKKSLRP